MGGFFIFFITVGSNICSFANFQHHYNDAHNHTNINISCRVTTQPIVTTKSHANEVLSTMFTEELLLTFVIVRFLIPDYDIPPWITNNLRPRWVAGVCLEIYYEDLGLNGWTTWHHVRFVDGDEMLLNLNRLHRDGNLVYDEHIYSDESDDDDVDYVPEDDDDM